MFAAALVAGSSAAQQPTESVWIRANQIGYLPSDPKIAILSSDRELRGEFRVGSFTADIGPDAGRWGPFPHNYRLDFSEQRTPGRYAISFGGATSLPFSIGEHAYTGVPAKLLSVVGPDAAGEFYREALTAAGVDAAGVKQHSRAPTGRCLCFVTPDSQRTMRTYLGASAEMGGSDVVPSDFEGCGHAHVEGYLLFDESLLVHVLATARDQGCTVSLDLAAPEVVETARTRLPDLLREYVDMVFANEDEAAMFAGTEDEAAALAALAELCPTAVVKLGARGALLAEGGETIAVPAKRVHAVDTTGAGDLWAAGFLFGMVNGHSVESCGRIASLCGYEVCRVVGANIPDAGWERIGRQLPGLYRLS